MSKPEENNYKTYLKILGNKMPTVKISMEPTVRM